MAEQTPRPSISANPDEAAGRRRPAGGRKGRSTEGETANGPGRGPGFVLVALALIGVAVAGGFIYLQQQALVQAGVDLEAARQRILALEERLNMTDEALSETGQKSSEQISFWESEIRKLWAVVNERNMNLIKENAAAVDKVGKSAASLEAAVREMRATLGRHESAFARQEQMVDQITNLDVQMQQVQRAVRDVVDRANAAQQSVAGLNAGLTRRVTETEEAIKAFDAYRLQTNARIVDLERRLAAAP
ncbi:MAG: hypothetical protein KF911_00970 [Pseudomonadales bacterium]|nr:hypothetical protein [Pseudomonadales bacterium]